MVNIVSFPVMMIRRWVSKARLEQAWPDSLAEGQLIKDDEGRDQLQAMPKAAFLYVPRSVAHQPGGPLLGSPARA
jgi:hypothetical protein